MHRILLVALLIITGCILSACTGNSPAGKFKTAALSTFDPVELAKKHPIAMNRPAVGFFEGALLGNGGLGVVVCTRPDAVVLYFGHNDVWDIRIAENNREKIGAFSEIFKKVKAIPDTLKNLEDNPWYKKYLTVLRENYSKPYPRPFPCGSAVLWFDRREAELMGHRLNLDTGVCEVNFLIDNKIAHLEVFIDMTADCLRARMVDGSGRPIRSPFRYVTLLPDPETPGEMPKYTTAMDDENGILSFRQALPFEVIKNKKPSNVNPRDRAFRLSARVNAAFDSKAVLKTGEDVTDIGPIPGQPGGSKPLRGIIGQTSDFSLCIQLDHGNSSSVGTGLPDIPAPTAQSWADAAGKSRDIWHQYWEKSGVSLSDEVLEGAWYRNLYFLRCALRPDVTCPGLFANWSYRNIGTAWHGDYHMNYNTQQPFWAAFSSNHADLHLLYVDMVERTLLPVSKKWARDYYGLRGAFFPHSAYPVEMNIMPYPLPTWGWEVFETPWAVQSLWWHYQYTQDRTFLRDRAFGVMKEAVLFMVDYMKRPEARGQQWGDDKYHIFPSVPPELYGLQPGFVKNSDTIADLSLTRHVFNAFVSTCAILGYEKQEADLLGDVRDILSHFPDYPKAQSSRGEVFVSVKGEDPEIVYNVPVSLMTVFPGDQHGLFSPPEEYRIAANTYRNQQNEGGNDLVFLNVQAARLGLLDIEKFKRQIEYCLLPDGSCTDKVLQIHGRYTNATPFDFMAPMGIWFENFSLPLVINECLLQSYTGTMRLFPNWPSGKNAEFKSLRTVGAFLVSARKSGEKVEWIEVFSEAGQPFSLISPWKVGAILVRQSGKEKLSGNIFLIKTKPGETFRLLPR
jgi:alpha-L-fucosidase 2